MKSILDRINAEFINFKINDQILQNIITKLINKILLCYTNDLKKLSIEQRNKKIIEIIHNHCINCTRITKTSIRKILKSELSTEYYNKYSINIIYAIITAGCKLNINNCTILMENIYMNQLNSNPKLEILAKKVLSKVNIDNATKEKFGSVVIILMVISIILTLVRAIQECRKNQLFALDNNSQCKLIREEIKNISIKKNLLNQFRLNRILKQQMPKEDYKQYGKQLKNAILEYGSTIDEEDSSTIVNALNGSL